MKLILIFLGFFSSALALSANALEATELARNKNVIVVFCDDLGYGELPVYHDLYQGGEVFKTAIGSFTPNLDRLADEGMVFTRAYSHNWCAPSRQMLLSGLWQMRKSAYKGQAWMGRHMRDAGLKTAQFGKYHGSGEEMVTLPHNGKLNEFDEYFGFDAASNYYRKAKQKLSPKKNAKVFYRVDKKEIDFEFPREGEYLTDTLSELSVDFINRCSAEKQPFFLYLPYNAPHSPIQAKAEDLRTLFPEQFEGQSDDQLEILKPTMHKRQRIMAMMYAVDRGIGAIIEALEKNGQLDDTLIVFTSDNNGEEKLSLTYPLHGYKHETFEGGTRVPFIAWSKALRESTTKPDYYDGLVSVCDILPTALKFVKPSTDLNTLMTDGTDIMPYILGDRSVKKGRRFYTTRILTSNSNTWDFGRDTKEKTTGYSQALIVDDYKIMKLFQDRDDESNFRYVLHYLPDVVGKLNPQGSLREDYYKDNTNNPEKKSMLIKKLEQLIEDPDLHSDWSAGNFRNLHPAFKKTLKEPLKFHFGKLGKQDDHTEVNQEFLYSAKRGYGFERLSSNPSDVAILNFTKDYVTSVKPFFYSVNLKEGNYRVTVVLPRTGKAYNTTIRAETRRLMVQDIKTNSEKESVSFIVNVRNSKIQGGGKVVLKEREIPYLHWDDKLTIEMNGSFPALSSIEIAPANHLQTVFLAGDSTVCDQPGDPWCSWGQMLTRFFKPEIAIANHAMSGATVKSSLSRRRFDKIFSMAKANDYLFIQFGHNDMKDHSEHALTSFSRNLTMIINRAKAAGVRTVLVTSMERKKGAIRDTLGEYPDALRQLAKQESIPLIDLNVMSKRLYKALGSDLGKAFADGSHHNSYGSYQLAKCMVKGIRKHIPELAVFLHDDLPLYDETAPDPPSEFKLHPSPIKDPRKPDGS